MHTFYVELHNGYVIGEDSYLEWYKTQEVGNKYYSERFQFFQNWGSEPENLLKHDSHGSAVAVYEYESNKKVPTKDALKVCCEDDAFEAMPYAWNAHNLVTTKGMTLKDSSKSTNKPVSTDRKFDTSYSYMSQSNICKASNYNFEDHSVSSGSVTECDTTLC